MLYHYFFLFFLAFRQPSFLPAEFDDTTAVPRPLAVYMYISASHEFNLYIYLFLHLVPAFIYIYLFVCLSIILMSCQIQMAVFFPSIAMWEFLYPLFFCFSYLNFVWWVTNLPAYDYIFCFVASRQPTLWFIDSQVEVIFAKPNEYPVHVISMWTWVSRGTLSHLGCAKFFLEPSLSC